MLTTGILGKLQRDHAKISRLVSHIHELADTGSARYDELFSELRRELLSHCAAEDRVLYAALSVHADCQEDVKDGREERDELEEILAELERCDDEDECLSALQELEEAFEHHVGEIEAGMFAHASRLLGEERLQSLAAEYQRERARARAEISGEDEDDDEDLQDELEVSRDSLPA